MRKLVISVLTLFILSLAAAACAGETVVREVPVEVVVEKEIVKEVAVEKIVTQEVVKTVEVPVEKVVTQEVIKEVMVPGETKVVEKEVVKEVPVEVVVEKEVVKEVVREVVVEKPVIKEVIKGGVRRKAGRVPRASVHGTAGRLGAAASDNGANPREPVGHPGPGDRQIRRRDPTWIPRPWGHLELLAALDQHSPGRWTTDGGGIIPAFSPTIKVSDDGTQFTFAIREGARWSDGTPHTADDWEFMHDAWLADRDLIQLPLPGYPWKVRWQSSRSWTTGR